MKTTFTYAILRYVHDIATGEFVNMGVALYAPEAKYVSAICSPRYGRLSKMFLDSQRGALAFRNAVHPGPLRGVVDQAQW